MSSPNKVILYTVKLLEYELERYLHRKEKGTMASKFITNSTGNQTLQDRFGHLAHKSTQLDFLVGYFFFSGFYAIYKHIENQKIRILVGMDVELDLNNCIHEFTLATNSPSKLGSISALRAKYFENIKNSINKSDLFDNEDFQKSYKVFLRKLEDGSLEVRKTREPNHAKMYLFYIPPEKGAAYDRTERDAHRAPEPRQYYHDAEKRADYCCGVIFQSQQHRNIPRQAAQDDTCRQFVFICV